MRELLRTYYIDHLAAPTIVLALAWTWGETSWWPWVAFGVVLFTLVEYWTHRTLLHGYFWHGQHERHHTHPEEYVSFPWWYLPGILAGFFIVLPLSVFCGFLLGYTWFVWWHDALHHWQLDRRPWVRAYARWHNVHHAGIPANYGITHPLWDLLFGTYRRAPR